MAVVFLSTHTRRRQYHRKPAITSLQTRPNRVAVILSATMTKPTKTLELPDWLSHAALFSATEMHAHEVPATLAPWVDLSGSMTQAIMDIYAASPEVTVHHSDLTPLRAWESEKLNAPTTHTHGYARHISLNVHETPVLAARSVTLKDSPIVPLLADLQSKPLARVLFEDKRWQRQGLPIPLKDGSGIIGRACVWRDLRTQAHLLVEEFFLFN